MIPLILKLKKAKHKEIARAQDLMIEGLYKVFDKAVLHGGTSIWRCYDGNRFSEDVDVYLPKETNKINVLFENLKSSGFEIIKKKIGERSVYSVLKSDRTLVRFEATFQNIKGILSEYTTAEGTIITVYTLTPETLIKEKVNTYLKRFKIRDLYDIFYLLRHVKNKNQIKGELANLIKKFKPPVDKNELKVLIIEGLTPEVEEMLYYIKNWCD